MHYEDRYVRCCHCFQTILVKLDMGKYVAEHNVDSVHDNGHYDQQCFVTKLNVDGRYLFTVIVLV